MRRRDFVKSLLAASGTLAYQLNFLRGFQAPTDSPEVKRVLVLFKCHLDVGYTDTQAGVMRKYFDQYFPRAMQAATAMRQAGADRYVWTTGSWIFYEYLEQASAEQRQRIEQAVAAGDLAWHALPFSWETEFLDRSMIEGAVGLSKTLDRRFGRITIGAKTSDVPGQSRGLVGPLAAQGVKFVDVGVNDSAARPEVPHFFVWQDPDGASLIMMHHHKYGETFQVPGSDLVVSLQMRGDNQGPHSVEDVTSIYADLRKRFPHAQVTAATLSEIATAVVAYRNQLPVVTQEVGDTWIYGIPSDPIKVARYREVARLRQEWLQAGKFRVGDSVDCGLLRHLTLCAEHTWGYDSKRLEDYQHYRPQDMPAALELPKFRVAIHSWEEKRKNIDNGIASLPEALRNEAQVRLRSLIPVAPEQGGLLPHRAGSALETAHWVLAIDPATGAINKLRAKKTGREWASTTNPLALFSYQTLSKADYDRYWDDYIALQGPWVPGDFGKPKIEDFGAQSRVWTASLQACWFGKTKDGHRLLAQLRIDDPAAEQAGLVAWPGKMFMDVLLPDNEPVVRINFTCFEKAANRLPEAMWLSFRPQAPEVQGWMLEKVDRWVSPLDVVPGGGRLMHAVSREVRYQDERGSLSIETLDAPVVALGEKSPIAYSTSQPDISKGLHFSLYNNAWGTNYIQWFSEDTQFRFALRA